MMNYHKKSGFTLIELLVVITIILILAAILFPVFAAAREKAIQNNCLGNLKNLSSAVHQYIADFDDKMLSTGNQVNVYNAATGVLTTPGTTWYDRLAGAGYIGKKPKKASAGTGTDYASYSEVFSCPGTPENAMGYAINIYASNVFSTTYPPYLSFPNGASSMPCSLSVMKSVASTIYFCEAGSVPTGTGSGARGDVKGATEWIETVPAVPAGQTKGINTVSSLMYLLPRCRIAAASFNNSTSLIYVPRHNGGTNCLMVDGHTKWYSIKELDKWQYATTATAGNYLGSPGCPWDNAPD